MSPRSVPITVPDDPQPTSEGPSYYFEYLETGINPFEDDLSVYSAAAVPLSQLRDSSLPIGLLITAYLIRQGIGVDRSDVRHGLRDLLQLHASLPISELVGETVRADEPLVREFGRLAAEDRLADALRQPEGVERDRAIERARATIDRNGLWRWQAYTSAVATLHRFAGGINIPGLPGQNPARGLIGGTRGDGESAREALTEQQLDAVWESAASYTDPELAGLVLDLLRETGTRIQSVIDLHLDEINWANSTALLHTKGYRGARRTHIAVVSGDLLTRIALRAIEQGWDGQVTRPPAVDDLQRRAIRPRSGRPLSKHVVENLFIHIDRRLTAEGQNFGYKITPHYIRHTTIAQVDRIAGPEVAAQYAGHDPEVQGPGRSQSTSIYIRWRLDEIKVLFARMFKFPPEPVDPRMLFLAYEEMLGTGETD